jgi:hypothetical protein
MTTGDDDRIAYLEGEGGISVPPEERAELDALRALLQDPSSWEEPNPALEDRIVAAIADEAAAAGASSGTAQHRTARRFSFRIPRLAFGGGLATAAAAVAAAIVIATSGGPEALHFTMSLSGTALAPDVHGTAQLTKTSSGWRIQVSATGLPHLADGRYYQAWLKNASGILVPVGTFNDARSVTLWSGVPVTMYRTLTVTRQVANGNPASSGQRVLVGTIVPSR